MRQTKIIATVGPASDRPEILDALIAAGVDVFRLNFSHGTHETHAESFRRIREAARQSGRHVAIMQDLSGPKIRTGPLAGGTPIPLKPGDELRIAHGDAPGSAGRVFTRFAELIRSANPGARLLLDDGRIELKVVARSADELTTVVVHGATLGEHKGINAPGVTLPTSALTPKDIDDLEFGLRLGVDLVALSFVQTADDVRLAASHMAGRERVVPIIAKVERPAAIDNLAEILKVAQGVMVARGDLGLELPFEQVPRVQKEIIRAARTAGPPGHRRDAGPRFDARRAAADPRRGQRRGQGRGRRRRRDHADRRDGGGRCIRCEAVETLDLVIRDAESAPRTAARHVPAIDPGGLLHSRALCEAACTLAARGHADAIVAVTREGKTARLLSALRPSAPVFAATAHEAGRILAHALLGRDPDPHARAGRRGARGAGHESAAHRARSRSSSSSASSRISTARTRTS